MLAHMSITLDTTDVSVDTRRGNHPRITETAIERAKTKLGVHDLDAIAGALGFNSRMTFWRTRVGLTPVRLSDAQRIARQLGMRIEDVFTDA
jgi:hypothetical protein